MSTENKKNYSFLIFLLIMTAITTAIVIIGKMLL